MPDKHYRESTAKDPLHFVHSWKLWEKRGDYRIWCRGTADYQTLWNVTKTDNPPLTNGGYYDKQYLLSIKSIKEQMT